jgi:hypothetical protein
MQFFLQRHHGQPQAALAGLGWLRLSAVMLLLALAPTAQAQVAGTKTIPGDYATIAAAITALNTLGVGTGGVTFNVAAGHTETSTAAVLTATGTAAKPIVFQKSGAGTNPLITAVANSGTGAQDGIIRLSGTDYCTFDGIDVSDANNTAATANQQMEFGYALFRASTTDGCQNNTIKNCAISLNKANASTIAIWLANSLSSAVGAIVPGSAAGAQVNNKLNGNTITNAFVGIYVAGGVSGTLANNDSGNEVGTTAGNTITNIAGSDTPAYGIRAENQANLKVENNSVSIPTGNTGSTVRGIGIGAGNATGIKGTLLLNNNTVTVASATTSSIWGIHQAGTTALTDVRITNNKVLNMALTGNAVVVNGIEDASTSSSITTLYINGNEVSGSSTTTTNTFHGIYHSGTSLSGSVDFSIAGNKILNNTRSGNHATATNNQFYAIRLSNFGSAYAVTIDGNIISGNQLTSTNGIFYGMFIVKNIPTFSNNTITNNSIPSTSGSNASEMYGYYNVNTSAIQETLSGNTITGLAISGSGSSTAHIIYATYSSSSTSTIKDYTQNTIGALTLGTGAGKVYGIHSIKGSPANFLRNKLYDISATGAISLAYGIFADGSGTTIMKVANNLVGGVRASAATSPVAVAGILVDGNSTSTISLFYNTIYLSNATAPSTTFGSSALQIVSNSPTFDLRNNILINTSAAGTASGYSLALRTGGALSAKYSTSSNNNLFYTGAGTRLALYGEGSGATPGNAKTVFGPVGTAGTFQAYVTAAREAASVSGLPSFLSTTGSASTFLHIDPTGGALVESAGAGIAGTTDDYDGDIRQGSVGYVGPGTAPDIGADEFSPLDLLPTALLAPAAGSCFNSTEALTVTVQNNGAAAVNFAVNPLTVSVAVTSANPTQNFTITLSTGTLAAGATQNITYPGTAALTAGLTYTFTITTAIAGDGNTGNDVLAPTRTVAGITPAAILSNGGPICVGNATTVSIALAGTGPWTFTYTDGATPTTVTATATNPYIITTPTLSANTTYSLTALSGPSCPATPAGLAAATTSITVNSTTTFTGSIDNDWNTAGNWSNCLPTALVSATIPTGKAVTLSSGTGTTNDLSIQGTATLTVAGATTDLDIKGSFTTATASSYAATAGTTSFSGSTAQPIPAGTYHHVVLTGSGATAKALAGSIMVNGDLDLTAGMLALGGFDVTMGAGSGDVLGASAAHFVVQNGNGRLCFNNVGAVQRPQAVFPIGTSAGSYTPATVANSGSPDQFCGHVADGISRQGNPVTSHVVNKTWDVSEGTAGGSNATLTLQWNAADEAGSFDRSNVTVAHYMNSAWEAACAACYGSASGSDPYTLSRAGITSFSPFGVEDNTKPLPVSLTHFDAVRSGTAAELRWSTASEKNNAGFEVQLSTDGRQFRALAFVAGHGSTASLSSYAYTDREAGKAGPRYYRLRQVDFDGSASFSPVRSLTFGGMAAGAGLSAVPNPFTSELTLWVQARDTQAAALLTLTDATGRTVLKQLLDLPAGSSQLPLRGLEQLPRGVYLLHLLLDGQPCHLKVVKQ